MDANFYRILVAGAGGLENMQEIGAHMDVHSSDRHVGSVGGGNLQDIDTNMDVNSSRVGEHLRDIDERIESTVLWEAVEEKGPHGDCQGVGADKPVMCTRQFIILVQPDGTPALGWREMWLQVRHGIIPFSLEYEA